MLPPNGELVVPTPPFWWGGTIVSGFPSVRSSVTRFSRQPLDEFRPNFVYGLVPKSMQTKRIFLFLAKCQIKDFAYNSIGVDRTKTRLETKRCALKFCTKHSRGTKFYLFCETEFWVKNRFNQNNYLSQRARIAFLVKMITNEKIQRKILHKKLIGQKILARR